MERGPAEPERFPLSPSPNVHPPGGIWGGGGCRGRFPPASATPAHAGAARHPPARTPTRLQTHACLSPSGHSPSRERSPSLGGTRSQEGGTRGGGSQRPQPGLCPSPSAPRSACSRFPAAALPPGGATVGSRGQGTLRDPLKHGDIGRDPLPGAPPPAPAKPLLQPAPRWALREFLGAGFRVALPAPSPKPLHPWQARRHRLRHQRKKKGKRGGKKPQKSWPQPFPSRGAAPKGLTQPGPILKREERCSLIPIHSFRDIIIVFRRCNHSIYLRIKLV